MDTRSDSTTTSGPIALPDATTDPLDQHFSNISISTIIISDPACNVTRFVLNEPYLTPLMYVQIAAGVAAVLSNVLLISAIGKTKAFHTNLRCLLIFFSVCLAWFGLSRAYKAAYILTIYYDWSTHPCAGLRSSYRCQLDEIWISIPSYLAPWSFFGLCLERLYATVRFKNYETSDASPYVLVVFVGLVSVTPLAAVINTILRSPTNRYTPLCEGLLAPARASLGSPLWVSLATVVACLISALCCKYWNEYKMRAGALNRVQHTLASRFQISQNVQINRMLLPTLLLQTLCHLPHYILLILLLSGLELSMSVRSIMINCNYTWRLIYAALHPVLAFRRVPALRHRLVRTIPCLNRKLGMNKVMPFFVAETKQYFDMMDTAWEKRPSTSTTTHNNSNRNKKPQQVMAKPAFGKKP